MRRERCDSECLSQVRLNLIAELPHSAAQGSPRRAEIIALGKIGTARQIARRNIAGHTSEPQNGPGEVRTRQVFPHLTDSRWSTGPMCSPGMSCTLMDVIDTEV